MLKDAYAGFAQGDLSAVLGLLCEDITWEVTGQSPLAGVYTGKDQVLAFFGKMAQIYEGTLQLEVVDVVANANRGIVLTVERGRSHGETIAYRSLHVYDFDGAMCVRFVAYQDDAYHHFWNRQALSR